MTEKTDLQKEAKKLGLDTSGTTANLKARLAAFAKQEEERAAAGHVDTPPDTSGGDNPETPDEPEAQAPVEEDTVPDDNPYNISIGRTDKGFIYGTSNRFSIGGSERYGLPIIGISSTNHVGPAPLVIPAAELTELAALLKHLSVAQPEAPEEE
jgi:hypothetical protein